MPTLADFVPQGRTIILVGSAGCGKSTFAFRFGRVFALIADPNGLAGPIKVAKKENRFEALSQSVKYEYLHQDEKGPIALEKRFDRMCKLISQATKDDSIDTIVLDSTTSLVPVFKAKVAVAAGKSPDSLLEGWNQWDQFASLWTQLLDYFLQSTKINILIAHESVDKDEMDKISRYALAIPGKSADTLCRLVSDVWLMSVSTKVEGNPPELKSQHLITTVQNALRPNIKSTLDIPNQFPATQEWAEKIMQQIKS